MLIAWGNSNSFYDILKAIVKKYVGDFLKLPLYVYLLSSKAKAGKSREHNLRKILAFPGIFAFTSMVTELCDLNSFECEADTGKSVNHLGKKLFLN